MSDELEGLLLFSYGGCTFRIAPGAQPPKAGSLLFCRHLGVQSGERVLEIGAGTGLAAVLAARAGALWLLVPAIASALALTQAIHREFTYDSDATEADTPVAEAFDARWGVWAAGFGGSQSTSGDAALGSNKTTSNVFGTAAGARRRRASW